MCRFYYAAETKGVSSSEPANDVVVENKGGKISTSTNFLKMSIKNRLLS